MNKYVIITGSNAFLLSKELGTKLTGRHLNYELFPFSYKEMLKFKKFKQGLRSFEFYLKHGGFPDYLRLNNPEILQELLNDILAKDIAARYNLKNMKLLKEIATYLLSNSGKEFSYNSLKNIFKLGSVNTAISYVSYFEDSYLLFAVPRFDYSLKKQSVNPKKIYCVDNGFLLANSFTFSSNYGKLLENLVFTQLRRKHNDIYYFKQKNECDFVLREAGRVTAAIQVCYCLNDDNKERELNGLLEVLNKFKLKEGLILTYDQEDSLVIGKKKITVVPVWKWLI